MCGIFGWIKFTKSLTDYELKSCRSATTSLVHRGPDAEGEWFNNNIFMGHRRLSIIDLSNDATQPYQSKDGRYLISFNGEIYNYIELRNQLEKEGIQFYSQSDTEVLINSLIFWGIDGLNKLDGMFAGAFHDRLTGKHIIFRDPLGQKPLYVYEYEEGVIYSSELRALLELDNFSWKIDRDSFRQFLLSSYYPWNMSPIKGIEKLLPGSLWTIDNNYISKSRWWDSIPGEKNLDIGMNEAVTKFEKLLDRSCELSLRSDVPVGVFLSGGIDSSLLLSSCHKVSNNIKTFSVSMSEIDYDESSKAEFVSKLVGAEHKFITLDQNSLLDNFTELMNKFDEPHGDPGFVNSYFLTKNTKNDITVAVGGDGADELFCGYIPFKALLGESIIEKIPREFILAMKKIAQTLPSSDKYLSFQFKSIAYLQAFLGVKENRHGLWLSTLSPNEISSLLPLANKDIFDPLSPNGAFNVGGHLLNSLTGKTSIQKLLYYYQKIFLPEFVCHHTDRASMLNNMEVRSPFLSIPLIEFSNQLPDKLKMQGTELKLLLRKTLANRGFPKSITNQQKQGFTFPIARWMKGQLREMVINLNTDIESLTDGEVSSCQLKIIIDQHLSGKRNNYRIIYNLMVFSYWRKRYPNIDFA